MILLLTVVLILLVIDGRNVARAAEKPGRPWSSAMTSKDWPTATGLLQEYVKVHPEDAAAQHDLGRALLAQGQLPEAEIHLISAESLVPSLIEYKVSLADLYERKGRDNRTLASGKLQEALTLDPSRVDLRWRLARNLYASGAFDESLAELRLINQMQPDNLDAYRLTADVAMGRKKYDQAIENLKVYTAVVPDGRGFTRLAQAYMSLTPADTANAQKAALQALRLNPDDSQAALVMARTNTMSLGQKGLSPAESQRRAKVAIGYYQKADDYTLSKQDWDFVGRIQSSALKDLPAAETAYRNASAIDTTKTGGEYRSRLGANLIQQRKYADAVAIYREYVNQQPGNASAWVNLGQAYHASGEPDKAIESYNKALSVDPNSGAAHKGLGDVLMDKGQDSDAIDAYRNATKFSTKDGSAWGALGYALWKKKDFGGSVEPLQKALEIDPCDVRSIQTLALSLKELGRVPDAISWLKKGLTCDPGNSALKATLASLGG